MSLDLPCEGVSVDKIFAKICKLDWSMMTPSTVSKCVLTSGASLGEAGSVRAVTYRDGSSATVTLQEVSEATKTVKWSSDAAPGAVETFAVTSTSGDTGVLTWSTEGAGASAELKASTFAELSGCLGCNYGWWTSTRVRSAFTQFFGDREHSMVPSSKVVPFEDPTLLFTNAGMNQFKPIFLGTADPSTDLAKLKRAANTQKCIRAGGKHNDLDDVGKDVYHHTFFEMLGNWSFGDYFKEEAIGWAWQLLTEVYGLDPERLYASYFEGSVEDGTPCDDEARLIWLKYLPAERVLPFDKHDNFWEMGATGPCGPCVEIHYDRIGGRDASHLVNAEPGDPNVLEIWNNVFMQFNRKADGSLERLPANSVDTGMGFERLSSILQNKLSNYDTDLFTPIFAKIHETCAAAGTPPYGGVCDEAGVSTPAGYRDMAYRVVADHIRTLTFAITDGAVPSNQGRGYVLRRVLRRGVRFGNTLGCRAGFFRELVATLVGMMSPTFPELIPAQAFVEEIIGEEEDQFRRTIERGMKYFAKTTAALPEGVKIIPGAAAWQLWNTFGFPIELSCVMAEEEGFSIDMDAFAAARAKDVEASKKGGSSSGGVSLELIAKHTDALNTASIAYTVQSPKFMWHEPVEATVVGIFAAGELMLDAGASVTAGPDVVGVILDTTSFYATMGGQVSDLGTISASGASDDEESTMTFTVAEAKVFGGFVLHQGGVDSGTVTIGDKVTSLVNYSYRGMIAPNHTMTHVASLALRTHYAADVAQKGSLCDAQKIRFDFAGRSGLTMEQLEACQKMCQDQIAAALPVHVKEIPFELAKTIKGLRYMAEAHYPTNVRVVSIGVSVDELLVDPSSDKGMDFSVELCGGTHITNISKAVQFVILDESSISMVRLCLRLHLHLLMLCLERVAPLGAGVPAVCAQTLCFRLDN